MELNQLNSFSFPEHIKVSNCCVWSDDNTVAVIGIKGVFVVGFVSDFLSKKSTLKVHGRSKISISQNFPAYYFGANVDELLPTLDDEEKYQMLVEGMLTPHIDENVICVHQIRWSPRFIHSSGCILGVLSNHGSLELSIKDVLNWTGVFDIGIEWKKHLTNVWSKKESSVAFSRELFLERFKQLRIVAFTWTHNFVIEGKLHCILIAGHNDGQLTVWKLKQDPGLTVAFGNSVNSDLDTRIQSLYWYPISNDTGWLIITTVDGIVNLYTCCWNETYTTLSVNYLSTIWSERDHVLVSNLQLKSRQDDVIFVMSKERLVIVILLSQMGIILQQAYFRVTDYRVTGLDVVSESQIFVLLVCGLFYLLNIKETLKDSPKDSKSTKPLTLTRENIPNHLNYAIDGTFSFGVSFSPNKMFSVIVSSISGVYDHLANREPSSLILSSMYTDMVCPLKVVRSLLYKDSFYEMQDCFEIIRLYLTEDFVTSDLHDLLDVCNPFVNFELTSMKTSVQVFYWLVKILKSNSIECAYTKDYDLEKLEITMVMSNIFRYINNVTSSRQNYLIREWIAANVSKLPETCQNLVETATEILYRFSDVIHEESCNICASKITILDQVRYIKCAQDHVMLRCVHSLIPVGSNPCRTCPCCSSVVLASEDVYQCILCDGLLYKRAK